MITTDGGKVKKFIVEYKSCYANLSTSPSRVCIEAEDWTEAQDEVLRFNGGTVYVVSIFDITPGDNYEPSNENQ